MAPSALPLPAAASKVARKEKETSRSNERFLKFAMIVFLGLFTYFTVGFASIGLGHLVLKPHLLLDLDFDLLLHLDLALLDLPSSIGHLMGDPHLHLFDHQLLAISTAAFGLAALGVYADTKTLLLPLLILKSLAYIYACLLLGGAIGSAIACASPLAAETAVWACTVGDVSTWLVVAVWHCLGFWLILSTTRVMAADDHRALYTILIIPTKPNAIQEENNKAVVEDTKVEVETPNTALSAPQL